MLIEFKTLQPCQDLTLSRMTIANMYHYCASTMNSLGDNNYQFIIIILRQANSKIAT